MSIREKNLITKLLKKKPPKNTSSQNYEKAQKEKKN
jgi:hypothetical protein